MQGALPQILFIGVLVAAFWLLIIRPQQRQRAQHAEMVNALQPGARVMTAAGIFGTVKALEGDNVLVTIADGVDIEMVSGAISRVVTDDDEPLAGHGDEGESHEGHDDPVIGDEQESEDVPAPPVPGSTQ